MIWMSDRYQGPASQNSRRRSPRAVDRPYMTDDLPHLLPRSGPGALLPVRLRSSAQRVVNDRHFDACALPCCATTRWTAASSCGGRGAVAVRTRVP